MVPSQRLSLTQQRSVEMRRLNADALRQQSAMETLYDLVVHELSAFVPGRGTMTPRLMFVGEKPSLADANKRAPLSGPAGIVFDKLLDGLGMTRNEVYVTHLVPWYPPNDRTTTFQERHACLPWLRREHVVLGRPPVVLLGRGTSEHLLVRKYQDVLGQWSNSTELRATCFSARHPAYAVYQQSNYSKMVAQWQRILDHPSEILNAT